MALILDTGPLYAALDRRDGNHALCRRLLESTSEDLVIPVPVLVGVDYFIHSRANAGVRDIFLGDIVQGAYLLEGLISTDLQRIHDLCRIY